MDASGYDILVRMANVAAAEVRARPVRTGLRPNEIHCRVERYAFTANNLTYGVTGDTIGYWKFFPSGIDGFGIVPVWGYATVVETQHVDVPVGERLYGYWPMASDVVLEAGAVSKGALSDVAAHRAALPGVYNRYTRVAADPSIAPGNSDYQALLRPLFLTSFLIDDFLDAQQFYGAQTVVLGSASSKTAIGLAAMLAERRSAGLRTIGLTSPGNLAFVRRLGFYDEATVYDDIATMPKVASVFVDMSGSLKVLDAVHRHLDDALKYSCRVGLSHWTDAAPVRGLTLPGAKPIFFFAPDRIAQRLKDWGPSGFAARSGAALAKFVADAPRWLTVAEITGPEAHCAAYAATARGETGPDQGLIFVA